jgi:hypothetical protein
MTGESLRGSGRRASDLVQTRLAETIAKSFVNECIIANALIDQFRVSHRQSGVIRKLMLLRLADYTSAALRIDRGLEAA